MDPHVRPYHPNNPRSQRPRGERANKRTPAAPADPAPPARNVSKRAAEPKPRARRTQESQGAQGSIGVRPRARRAAGSGVTAPASAVQTTGAIEAGAETSEVVATLEERDEDTAGIAPEAIETPDEPVESGPGPVVGLVDFEEIFTRFQTPITNFVYRLVGNREQAYDLAQDVFVKAYRALAAGATIQAGALSSWLYRIASNTATDALRRRRLISWLPLSLFNDDRGVGAGMPGSDSGFGMPSPTEEHMASAVGAFTASYDGGRFEQRVADREIVERVLKRLPEKYAVCLLLYEHEGFSCAEIADVLSVTPSAVKMRLMRARERFISLYQQELEGRQ